jgi:hypothetical protein
MYNIYEIVCTRKIEKQDGGVQSMRIPTDGKTTDMLSILVYLPSAVLKAWLQFSDFRCIIENKNPWQITLTRINIQNPKHIVPDTADNG